MTKNIPSKLEKIVVNTSFGRISNQASFEDKILPELMKEFAAITGQKPEERPAKKSIAGFKIRSGQIIALRVTLRGHRMTQFLNKLVKVVFPRIRDFRGIDPHGIDKAGNLNMGIRDHLVFPEIIPENSKVNFGMQITVVPKEPIMKREKSVELYTTLGVPLKKS